MNISWFCKSVDLPYEESNTELQRGERSVKGDRSISGLSPFQFFYFGPAVGRAGSSPTARVQRGPSEAARCASKGMNQTARSEREQQGQAPAFAKASAGASPLVALHRRAGAHEMPVAVGVVNPRDRGPELVVAHPRRRKRRLLS